jgi:hypothetical protein
LDLGELTQNLLEKVLIKSASPSKRLREIISLEALTPFLQFESTRTFIFKMIDTPEDQNDNSILTGLLKASMTMEDQLLREKLLNRLLPKLATVVFNEKDWASAYDHCWEIISALMSTPTKHLSFPRHQSAVAQILNQELKLYPTFRTNRQNALGNVVVDWFRSYGVDQFPEVVDSTLKLDTRNFNLMLRVLPYYGAWKTHRVHFIKVVDRAIQYAKAGDSYVLDDLLKSMSNNKEWKDELEIFNKIIDADPNLNITYMGPELIISNILDTRFDPKALALTHRNEIIDHLLIKISAHPSQNILEKLMHIAGDPRGRIDFETVSKLLAFFDTRGIYEGEYSVINYYALKNENVDEPTKALWTEGMDLKEGLPRLKFYARHGLIKNSGLIESLQSIKKSKSQSKAIAKGNSQTVQGEKTKSTSTESCRQQIQQRPKK